MTDPVPRLPALLEAVLGVGTELELRAPLQPIVDGAAELTGARYAALGVSDPAHDGLVEVRTAGRPDTEPATEVAVEAGAGGGRGIVGREDDFVGVPIRVNE